MSNQNSGATASYPGAASGATRACGRNLSPEGEHPPCSVSWGSSSSSSSDAYRREIHFLPEVIEGLFADGRLNAIRPWVLTSDVPGGRFHGADA